MRRLAYPAVVALLMTGCAGAGGGAADTSVRSATEQEDRWVHLNTGDYSLRLTRHIDTWTVRLDVPVSRVWSEVPAAYATLGLADAGRLEGAGRVYAFRGRMPRLVDGRRPTAFLRCGRGMTGDFANEYEVRLFVRTAVAAEGDGTAVSTTVDASAIPRGVSGGSVNCTSTGQLERAIAEALAEATLP